jgi:propionyl-CoA carboxylase alpha chain
VFLDHSNNVRKRRITGQMNGRTVKFETERHVKINGDWIIINVDDYLDSVVSRNKWQSGEPLVHLTTSIGNVTVHVKPVLNGFQLSWRGVKTEAHVYTAREAQLARLMLEKQVADTSKKLLCPMPGLVVSLAVVDGQAVKAGDTLCVVEAMKMQNVLRAERDVVVKAVNAKPGDSLAVDAVIMEFA